MKNILIFGGGGYVGTNIIKKLLDKGFKVINIDCFIYNHSKAISNFLKINNFQQHFLDFRKMNLDFLKKIEIESVIILGGLVGDPITKKYPDLSEEINFYSIKKIIDNLKNFNLKKLFFISTCSNYGIIKGNELANEETALKPISLYAKQKVKIEDYLFNIHQKENLNFKSTILRFATAFGYSDRMRFDLTINQFTLDLYLKKKIEIYDEYTWRPYCHIIDFADILLKLINKNYKGFSDIEIFNAGSNNNNFRKIDIFNQIKKYIPKSEAIFQRGGNDLRNYKVDFRKLEEVIPKSFKTIDFGINELITNLKTKKHLSKFGNLGNYEIDKKFI